MSAAGFEIASDPQYERCVNCNNDWGLFVFVTTYQKKPWVSGFMNDGEIVQLREHLGGLWLMSRPTIFIGESNILPGTMIETTNSLTANALKRSMVDEANEPVEIKSFVQRLAYTLPEEGKP